MARLSLTDVTKSFGETTVLAGIGLSIAHGEFLTLVGPSGCGKSTLLRIIAGLETADGGSVSIDGRDVTNVRPAERNLAMVFQSYALYPHLTVAENMMTPLRLRDLTAAQRLPLVGPWLAGEALGRLKSRVREVAGILQIEPLLSRKPGQLSGGQRQRVALGRAMVREPAAFLMDEPLSNLDAALRVHMRAELSELHRRLDTTFIYVTHDQAEALTMSDRMAVMMNGQILQLDTPRAVYDDPADLKVAEFIGSPKINALPGEAAPDGTIRTFGLTLSRRVASTWAGPVTVGLRPENLGLAERTSTDALTGRLKHVEHLGADAYVHVAMKDGAHRLIARAEPGQAYALRVGTDVAVRKLRGEALVFDRSGRRVPLLPEPTAAAASVH